MQKISFSVLIFLIIGGVFWIFNGVFAQQIGVTISPLTFELTANPGDVLTNKLRVYNPTDNVISVKMETEDFQAIGETGKVILGSEEDTTFSLKKWITTSPTEFTLKPKEQKFVDFILSVPENAEPGGKYGSILAGVSGIMGQEITGTSITQQVGALVLLTVAGEVKESLDIKSFTTSSFMEYGPVVFDIRFQNIGTVHAKPRGFVTITNLFGKKVADVEFPQLNVIPGATRKIETKWGDKWLFGKYTATLVGSYGTSNTPLEPEVITFWAFPWKIGLGIFLAIVIIFAFFYKTRKRWQLATKIIFKGERK